MEDNKKTTVKKETVNNLDIKKLNIFEKMSLATEKIARVAKNLKVDVSATRSYNAVSEGDILSAVKPVEVELGIYSYPVLRNAIVQEFVEKNNRQEVFLRLETVYRFVNINNPAEFIDITTYGDGVDSQDKATGKAMTYADKYALMKAYKIETGDDPDKEASGDIKKADKKKPVAKPITDAQKAKLKELGVDLNKLLTYFKKGNVDELTELEVAGAIKRKEIALKKQEVANNEKV